MSPFVIFLTVVLLVWTGMHGYVFWRLSTVPWITRHVSLRVVMIVAAALWLSYPLSRFMEGHAPKWIVVPLEYFAANWVGFLFLLLCALLAAEVATVGGLVFSSHSARIRGGAAVLAFILGGIALVQGHRQPVVTNHAVELEGLPPELDGTVVVAVSDLHLGTLIGRRWLERLVRQVNALEPDLVLAVGDVVDGNADRVRDFSGGLGEFRAPLGVWAVTGNHEYYAGAQACVDLFNAAGMRVLRDEAIEAAPGLVLAGVDDLTARQQFGKDNNAVAKALAHRPPGGTILLSHSPWEAKQAASAGAGLMISGHTHNGQIWPFTYMVRTRYPLLSGLYEAGTMKVIVGRGTGTWGPRMRLWQPGEILKITLRSPGKRGEVKPNQVSGETSKQAISVE